MELGLVLERKITRLPVVLNLAVVGVNPRERGNSGVLRSCMRIPILVQQILLSFVDVLIKHH